MQGINCASRDSPRLFPQGYVSVTPETPSTTKSNGTPCEIPISYSQVSYIIFDISQAYRTPSLIKLIRKVHR
ncbi:hypothetical protein HZH68_007560 [Vespula germanica]|uniref:Uncharacterized protein n=1 Tax=Vespula germanica TaxID=30212 RepID=A0A834K8C0_VESGE|nr:hypothetical protein HZH68_007560 [Vespula germanica]